MYDIAFLSFNEPDANNLYFKFLKRIANLPNRVYRIHGVKGIHQAHVAAAKQSTTNMFWVVDVDADLSLDFKFNTNLDPSEEDIVHVWRSKNPINDLEYGYGGVKLLPTQLTLNMDMSSPDMTTSISPRFKSVPQISNVTAFNINPLCTWRSAFRECAKLASRTISGQLDDESAYRLKVWTHVGGDRPFGEYALAGASAGEWFGKTYTDNKQMLAKINDYDWLTLQFDEHIKMFDPLSFIPPPTPPTPPTEEDRINWWRDAFKEAANTTDTDRLDELLNRGINEYTRSGASAGIWWGETYRTNVEKMQQLTDDKFLEGEFYWHTEQYPVEKFK